MVSFGTPSLRTIHRWLHKRYIHTHIRMYVLLCCVGEDSCLGRWLPHEVTPIDRPTTTDTCYTRVHVCGTHCTVSLEHTLNGMYNLPHYMNKHSVDNTTTGAVK